MRAWYLFAVLVSVAIPSIGHGHFMTNVRKEPVVQVRPAVQPTKPVIKDWIGPSRPATIWR